MFHAIESEIKRGEGGKAVETRVGTVSRADVYSPFAAKSFYNRIRREYYNITISCASINTTLKR